MDPAPSSSGRRRNRGRGNGAPVDQHATTAAAETETVTPGKSGKRSRGRGSGGPLNDSAVAAIGGAEVAKVDEAATPQPATGKGRKGKGKGGKKTPNTVVLEDSSPRAAAPSSTVAAANAPPSKGDRGAPSASSRVDAARGRLLRDLAPPPPPPASGNARPRQARPPSIMASDWELLRRLALSSATDIASASGGSGGGTGQVASSAQAASDALVGGLAKILGSLALAAKYMQTEHSVSETSLDESFHEALALLGALTATTTSASQGTPSPKSQVSPHARALQKYLPALANGLLDCTLTENLGALRASDGGGAGASIALAGSFTPQKERDFNTDPRPASLVPLLDALQSLAPYWPRATGGSGGGVAAAAQRSLGVELVRALIDKAGAAAREGGEAALDAAAAALADDLGSEDLGSVMYADGTSSGGSGSGSSSGGSGGGEVAAAEAAWASSWQRQRAMLECALAVATTATAASLATASSGASTGGQPPAASGAAVEAEVEALGELWRSGVLTARPAAEQAGDSSSSSDGRNGSSSGSSGTARAAAVWAELTGRGARAMLQQPSDARSAVGHALFAVLLAQQQPEPSPMSPLQAEALVSAAALAGPAGGGTQEAAQLFKIAQNFLASSSSSSLCDRKEIKSSSLSETSSPDTASERVDAGLALTLAATTLPPPSVTAGLANDEHAMIGADAEAIVHFALRVLQEQPSLTSSSTVNDSAAPAATAAAKVHSPSLAREPTQAGTVSTRGVAQQVVTALAKAGLVPTHLMGLAARVALHDNLPTALRSGTHPTRSKVENLKLSSGSVQSENALDSDHDSNIAWSLLGAVAPGLFAASQPPQAHTAQNTSNNSSSSDNSSSSSSSNLSEAHQLYRQVLRAACQAGSSGAWRGFDANDLVQCFAYLAVPAPSLRGLDKNATKDLANRSSSTAAADEAALAVQAGDARAAAFAAFAHKRFQDFRAAAAAAAAPAETYETSSFSASSLSTSSALAAAAACPPLPQLWCCFEAARAITRQRLKSPAGGPKDTFAVLERALRAPTSATTEPSPTSSTTAVSSSSASSSTVVPTGSTADATASSVNSSSSSGARGVQYQQMMRGGGKGVAMVRAGRASVSGRGLAAAPAAMLVPPSSSSSSTQGTPRSMSSRTSSGAVSSAVAAAMTAAAAVNDVLLPSSSSSSSSSTSSTSSASSSLASTLTSSAATTSVAACADNEVVRIRLLMALVDHLEKFVLHASFGTARTATSPATTAAPAAAASLTAAPPAAAAAATPASAAVTNAEATADEVLALLAQPPPPPPPQSLKGRGTDGGAAAGASESSKQSTTEAAVVAVKERALHSEASDAFLMPAPSASSVAFYVTNRKVCEDWFARVRPLVSAAAIRCPGAAPESARQGLGRLGDLTRKLSSLVSAPLPSPSEPTASLSRSSSSSSGVGGGSGGGSGGNAVLLPRSVSATSAPPDSASSVEAARSARAKELRRAWDEVEQACEATVAALMHLGDGDAAMGIVHWRAAIARQIGAAAHRNHTPFFVTNNAGTSTKDTAADTSSTSAAGGSDTSSNKAIDDGGGSSGDAIEAALRLAVSATVATPALAPPLEGGSSLEGAAAAAAAAPAAPWLIGPALMAQRKWEDAADWLLKNGTSSSSSSDNNNSSGATRTARLGSTFQVEALAAMHDWANLASWASEETSHSGSSSGGGSGTDVDSEDISSSNYDDSGGFDGVFHDNDAAIKGRKAFAGANDLSSSSPSTSSSLLSLNVIEGVAVAAAAANRTLIGQSAAEALGQWVDVGSAMEVSKSKPNRQNSSGNSGSGGGGGSKSNSGSAAGNTKLPATSAATSASALTPHGGLTAADASLAQVLLQATAAASSGQGKSGKAKAAATAAWGEASQANLVPAARAALAGGSGGCGAATALLLDPAALDSRATRSDQAPWLAAAAATEMVQVGSAAARYSSSKSSRNNSSSSNGGHDGNVGHAALICLPRSVDGVLESSITRRLVLDPSTHAPAPWLHLLRTHDTLLLPALSPLPPRPTPPNFSSSKPAYHHGAAMTAEARASGIAVRCAVARLSRRQGNLRLSRRLVSDLEGLVDTTGHGKSALNISYLPSAAAAAEVHLFCRYERAQLAFADAQRLGFASIRGGESSEVARAAAVRRLTAVAADTAQSLGFEASDLSHLTSPTITTSAGKRGPLSASKAGASAVIVAQADETVRRRVLVRALLRLAQWDSDSDSIQEQEKTAGSHAQGTSQHQPSREMGASNNSDDNSSSGSTGTPGQWGRPLLALATRVAPTSAKAWRRLGDWSLAQAKQLAREQEQEVIPPMQHEEEEAEAQQKAPSTNPTTNRVMSVEAWLTEAASAYGACLRASTSAGESSNSSSCSRSNGGAMSEGTVGGSAATMGVSLRVLELLDSMPAHVSSSNEQAGVAETSRNSGSGGGDGGSRGLASAVALATISESAPLEPWLAVVPQLLARLNHPSTHVAGLVHKLLARLAVAAPKALVLQVVVGVFETRPHEEKANEQEVVKNQRDMKTGIVPTLHGRYLSLRAALASGKWGMEVVENSSKASDDTSNDDEKGADSDRGLLVAEHEV